MSESTSFSGVYLRLYVQENRRHHGQLLHEWILALARELGLPGGSVFQAMAGYGHHGRLHRSGFLELQGELPLELVFAATDAQAEALMARLRDEHVELFWVRTPAQFGLLPGND